MDISSIGGKISGTDYASLKMQVESFNRALNRGPENRQALNKDDFLKILITQLSHQDPTSPMEDREFVAQMAQFSALEQMTNMSQEFSRLSGLIAAGQAMNVLGRTVDIVSGDTVVSGVVEAVTGGDFPQVLVNGVYYDFEQVEAVRR